MAASTDLPDQEPPGASATPGPEPAKGRSRRKALSSLRRELSDQELASPAVQKLLLDEIERLEQDCSDSASYRDRFHDADKKVGILEQKAQSNTAFEIISLTCITAGGAAVGYAPSVWSSQPTGFIALVFGVLLIIGGVAAKAVKA